MAGAVEADLFLDGPKKSERRVRQIVPQYGKRSAENRGGTGPIVRAQSRSRIGRPHEIAFNRRFAAETNRHRIHVGHEQPASATGRAWQFEYQIADFAGGWRASMRGIEHDGRFR